jgi:hypothetical protein
LTLIIPFIISVIIAVATTVTAAAVTAVAIAAVAITAVAAALRCQSQRLALVGFSHVAAQQVQEIAFFGRYMQIFRRLPSIQLCVGHDLVDHAAKLLISGIVLEKLGR